ncbi:lipoprotein-anchoring transpeptidase ErfK/SrfK [Sphingomonas insulae]|uniref:L,D-TPase catalytic domain-containing protein n=1 Tax=Sphingomonas insulae TaxID=424800 RepID=A0ABN1I035_9SPHN|nr:L,D-transpeptidase family protein [Sphingomonas insulae]NIJ30545.1 lipoprotein-anchoring transpeptidase ErfK/SrfK [Sphingomonas insulae]
MADRRQAIAAKLILAVAALGIAAAAAVGVDRRAPAVVPHPPASSALAAPTAAPAAALPVRRQAMPAPGPLSTPTSAPTPDPLVVKRVLDIGPIKFGDYAWDTKGIPDGPVIITVDLAAQVLSVFRGGYEIGAAAILYGTDDKPTPLGSFPITMKDAHHVSSIYGAPMPYTLRLTDDGVSVHGTEVAWGYATHGCIGVPTAFAKLLFAEAKLGDRVIITRGKTLATGEAIVGHDDKL